MLFEEFDEFARKLCAETEKIILEHYRNPHLQAESKRDDTPVTFADKESERVIRSAIEVLYPNHGIAGEEYGKANANAEYVWVIDPIDGTKTFVTGCPLFGTMIALLRNGKPLFGCINYPAIGKRLSGDGEKAFCNYRRIASRTGVSLNESTLLLTDFLSPATHQDGEAFSQLVKQVKLARTWGDCFGYCLLSEGKADIMLDPVMNPWDIMALVPIVRGAGAMITDWQGSDPAKGESIIAANSDLHEQVLASLNP